MRYECDIALKYLKKRRHGFFAFVTTLVAVGGITIGVAALVIVLSVMNGFRSDIQEKMLGMQPEVLVYGTEKLSPIDLKVFQDKVGGEAEVKASAPFILGQILLKSPESTMGVVVRGIDFAQEKNVTSLGKMLIAGSWDALQPTESAFAPKSVFLGVELARALGVNIGSELLAFSPTESAMIAGIGQIPKVEKMQVAGIFQAGYYEYDSTLAIISLEDARKLFAISGASGIGVRIEKLEDAEKVAARISSDLGASFWARSWQSFNRNLYKALKLEKLMMSLILGLIILVATFTIISNLILLSIEKTRDIGILRALGASKESIRLIFLYAGTFLGGAGVLFGLILGLVGVWVIGSTNLIQLPQDVYYIDHLPVKLYWVDLVWVALGAFLITLLTSLYPSRKAASINPVEAIRYG